MVDSCRDNRKFLWHLSKTMTLIWYFENRVSELLGKITKTGMKLAKANTVR